MNTMRNTIITHLYRKTTINITKYLKGSQVLVFVDLLSSSLGTWVHLYTVRGVMLELGSQGTMVISIF